MLPPASSKRPKLLPDVPRFQTPLRDEFKLNQAALDHVDADSAWERSSIASGVTQSQAGFSVSDRLGLSELLPRPKHSYEISEDVIMQKEEEIQRMEDERRQKDFEDQKDEDMEDMEKRMNEEKRRYLEIEVRK